MRQRHVVGGLVLFACLFGGWCSPDTVFASFRGEVAAPIARPTPRPAPTRAAPTRTAPAQPTPARGKPTVMPGSAGVQTGGYAATEMIRTFAHGQLGIDVATVRASGVQGKLTLPPSTAADVAATVEVAGQVSAGTITVGSLRGAAEVAIGEGSVSGDLDIDITNASLGAFSLAVPGSAPANADSALALIRATYPSLVNVALEPDDAGAPGYVFAASTVQQGVSRETHQVNAAAQEVLAGVSGQGSARVVWVVIGNGTFATALAPNMP